MNTKINFKSFNEFLAQYQRKIKNIAYRSKNALEVEEVMSEVVMVADFIEQTTNQKIDFSNPAHQTQIIAYTHQRLVHFDDGKVRHATSLDTPIFADGSGNLNEILPDLNGKTPEDTLIEEGESLDHQLALMDKGSAKVAWVHLIDHCGNNIRHVAAYLKLSNSYTYKCFNKVLSLAPVQFDLALDLPESPRLALSPWRKSRIYRKPVQLPLQLEYKTCLFGHPIQQQKYFRDQEIEYVRY